MATLGVVSSDQKKPTSNSEHELTIAGTIQQNLFITFSGLRNWSRCLRLQKCARCLKIHANNSQSFRTEQIWMWTMNDVVTVTPISRVIVVDCVQSALPTTMYQGRIPLVWGQSISCRQTSKRRLNIALASGPICLAFLLHFVDFRAVNVQLALCNIRLNKPLSWPTITP